MNSKNGSAYGIRLSLFAPVHGCTPGTCLLDPLFTAVREVSLEFVGVAVQQRVQRRVFRTERDGFQSVPWQPFFRSAPCELLSPLNKGTPGKGVRLSWFQAHDAVVVEQIDQSTSLLQDEL